MDSEQSCSDAEMTARNRKRRFSQREDESAAAAADEAANDDSSKEGEAPASKMFSAEVEAVINFKPRVLQLYFDLLCDELLLKIFEDLDTWTLMALMNCGTRYHKIVLEPVFWKKVDLAKEALPFGILEDVLERTHAATECVKLRGPAPARHVEGEVQRFNRTLLISFETRCCNISVLELQCLTIDFRVVRIVDFPKTLKRLLLIDCNIQMQDFLKSIFSGIDSHLTRLEELGVEYCDWLEPYYIMIFSKIPMLRWLSLKGCHMLRDFVPYGSMAARFGFKALEYLDMRHTPLNDSDLQCFNAIGSLKEFLLDSPNTNATSELTKIEEEAAAGNSSSDDNDLASQTTKATKAASDDDAPSTSSAASGSRATSENDSSANSSSSSASGSSTPPAMPPSPPPAARDPLAVEVGEILAEQQDIANGDMLRNQIIVIDGQNPQRIHRVDIHARVANEPQNDFNRVLAHPLFWDMVNPLGRGYPSHSRVFHLSNYEEEGRRRCIRCVHRDGNKVGNPISDRGICCFGRPPNPVNQGLIWLRVGNRPANNGFQRLTVRNYIDVTDLSLQHLVQCSPDLVYLDVSGTRVTLEGVNAFKAAKPHCQLVAHHLLDVPTSADDEQQ